MKLNFICNMAWAVGTCTEMCACLGQYNICWGGGGGWGENNDGW